MTEPVILAEIDDRGVATLTLNRPEVHNGYNDEMIAVMMETLHGLDADPELRALVIRGNGRHFSAGADVNWLKRVNDGESPDRRGADGVGQALAMLNQFSRPTVALVHGACIGGGVGWIACCDVAVASEDAFFAIPEVRLGFSPTGIVPLFVAAMGSRAFRRYGLTGERFGAQEAHRSGLIHEICPTGGLDEAAAPIIDALLLGGPEAIRETKRATARVAYAAISDALQWELETTGADSRASAEAGEGRASFLEKRLPEWRRQET